MIKKIFFIFYLITHSFFIQSQIDSIKKEPVYTIVEQMPSYPGGQTVMMKFIQRNIVYPQFEKEHDIMGSVYVTFIVDSIGNITQVKLLRGVPKGPYLEREALKIVRAMPRWIPGEQNGRTVNVQFNLPIKFTILNPNPKLSENITEEFTSKIREVNKYYDIGLEKFNSQLYEDAINNFSEVIKLSDHTHIDALYNRGISYIKLEKKELACIDFQLLKILEDPEAEKLLKKYCN